MKGSDKSSDAIALEAVPFQGRRCERNTFVALQRPSSRRCAPSLCHSLPPTQRPVEIIRSL